jgi:ankyrin repeat protein
MKLIQCFELPKRFCLKRTVHVLLGSLPVALVGCVTLLAVLGWSSASFGGEIHDAARNGDLERVKALLNANPKVVFSLDTNGDEEGCTPLHFAALNGHLDVVALLLASGAEVNATNRTGWTPLHVAAEMGWPDVAALLLTNHAEVNARDKDRDTPLHVAAETAGMVASMGRKDVAGLLVANGAKVDATNSAGETPLHVAAARGSRGVAALLLANHADVNARDNSGAMPLHWATLFCHTEVVALLLANHAAVNAKTNKGRSALNWTAFVGHDARTHTKTDDGCLTPLHIAAAGNNKDAEEMLLANKAEINAKDGNGWTPLHVAVFCGNTGSAELLRQHGGHE